MKGGSFRRWWGNQEYVIHFLNMGRNLLTARDDGTAPGLRFDNPNYYFRRGVTWNLVSSGFLSIRLSPGGFIFDVAAPSLFPPEIPLVLAVMNSSFATYALRLINPTVNFPPGDIA